jgi:cell division protein ZapE
MTPKKRYQQDLDKGLIVPDVSQQKAVEYLQKLFVQLTILENQNHTIIRSRFKSWFRKQESIDIRGLYFWGGVGRGKTYLMDIFYDCLPFEKKLRTHFHRFMQGVHKDLGKLKGQATPLITVADRIADNAKVICFDEFFVSDIGDAMLLAGLLERLFERGVVLIATSNIHPQKLYENGLQRERFLPAIDGLMAHTEVVELDGGIDYRLRCLEQAELYHWPLGADADLMLKENFQQLAPDLSNSVEAEVIDILGRPINSLYCADDVIWFHFDELCGGPRSAFDYVEIAKIYHALLISGISQMDDAKADQARRFINLVDELYDHGVKLIISATVPPDKLYEGSILEAEFKRTLSRLLEMQSIDYLSRPHMP